MAPKTPLSPSKSPQENPEAVTPYIPTSGSYGHLRELFEAVKDIVQKYIDLKEKVLSPSMFKNYDQILITSMDDIARATAGSLTQNHRAALD